MDRPDLPTMVDPATEKQPCRPGAWGSATNCATHEGLPLDETGRCFWGQEPSALEKAVQNLFTAPPAPPSTVRRLGTDEASMQLLNVPMLRGASLPALLRLARSLDVPVPRMRARGVARLQLTDLLAEQIANAIQEDRAKKNPIVDGPVRGVSGRIRTVG